MIKIQGEPTDCSFYLAWHEYSRDNRQIVFEMSEITQDSGKKSILPIIVFQVAAFRSEESNTLSQNSYRIDKALMTIMD